MEPAEMTTMCAVIDGNRVLMINRRKKWPGWAFPGGHCEKDESMIQCIRREMKEETGISVENLQYKGIVNIYNPKTKKRLFVTNYLSTSFSGTVKAECDEGKIEWIDIKEIEGLSVAEGLEYRLPLFFNEGITDLYIEWDRDAHYTKVEYKSMR